MNNYTFLNGIKVYSFESVMDLIRFEVEEKKILVAINADKISYSNDSLKQIINCNIGYPDGEGAVWALRRKGVKGAFKIAGCELWLEFIKHYYKEKTFYLVGSEESVIQAVVAKLKVEYPKIKIIGYRNGFFDAAEEEELIENIVLLKPDFLFIAMGSPRQEYLLDKISKKYQTTMLGLGGSFNVYSGKVKRAPRWMIRFKMESLYRYLFNRISLKRISHDLKFLVKLMLNKI